jgi:hypothetical protein
MRLIDVPIGSRVRVNRSSDHNFVDTNEAFDPSKPYIDGVLIGDPFGHSEFLFIAWREGEETPHIICSYIQNGFVSGAYIDPNVSCVLAP